MKPIDKKQLPQVIGLAVLMLGVFGYFGYKLLFTGPTVAAGSAAPPAATAPAGGTAPAQAGASTAAASTTAAVTPPSPNMRDPFVQTITDADAAPAVVQAAPAPQPRPAAAPAVEPLPAIAPDTVQPLPEVAAAPKNAQTDATAERPAEADSVSAASWVVTGVLQSGNEHVAILRNGDARKFVRQGDMLDAQYLVSHVGRDRVVLRHGAKSVTLYLGVGVQAEAPADAAARNGSGLPDLAPPAGPDDKNSDDSGPDADPFADPKSDPIAQPSTAPHNKQSPAPTGASGQDPEQLSRVDRHSSPPQLAMVAPETGFRNWLPHAALRIAETAIARFCSVVGRLIAPPAALPAVSPVPARPAASCAIVHRIRVVRASSIMTPALSTSGMLTCGTAAPDFKLRSASGESVSLSDFQGHIVVLSFFTSWCDVCRESMPQVAALEADPSENGLVVLSVDSWDNMPALNAFLSDNPAPAGHVLFDPAVTNESVAINLFRVPDLPSYYVIDRNGIVAAVFAGYTPDTLTKIKSEVARLRAF